MAVKRAMSAGWPALRTAAQAMHPVRVHTSARVLQVAPAAVAAKGYAKTRKTGLRITDAAIAVRDRDEGAAELLVQLKRIAKGLLAIGWTRALLFPCR